MAQADYKMGEPEAEGEHKKTSVVGKVKNKAKKLSSKIKGVSKKKKDRQPVEGEVVGEHEGTSSSSSSGEEEEEESPRGVQDYKETGVPAKSPDSEVHGGQGYGASRGLPTGGEDKVSQGYGASRGLPTGGEDKVSQGYGASRGLPTGEEDKVSQGIAGLKLNDVEGKEDPSAPAPTPAGWTQFEKETRPSWDEPGKRQHEVPAALGQESAGISSGLGGFGKSADRDVADPASVAAGSLVGDSSEEKIPEGILKPRKYEGEDAKPVVDGVDSSGRDLLASEVVDPEEKILPPRVEEQRPSFQDVANRSPEDAEHGSGGFDKGDALGGIGAVGAAGALGAAASGTDESPKAGDSQKGWMQRASEGVASVKNVLTSKLASPKPSEKGPEEKTWTESARETALGAKDSVTPSSTTTESSPIDSTTHGKTWTDSARDTATYAKEAVGSKLPSSTGPKDVTVTEKVVDSASNTEQKAADTTSSYTTKAVETATGLKDTIASKLGYGQSATSPTTKTLPAGTESTQPGVTQKVLGTVTGAKDAVASKLGYPPAATTTTDSTTSPTPKDTTGVKDTIASKLGYGQSATSPTSKTLPAGTESTQPGVTQKVLGTVTGAKDAVASKLGYSSAATTTTDSTTSPTPKDNSKLFTPDEHDAALSEKITNMLTLGGSKNTADTRTPASETAAETTTQTKEQGKGVIDRVSDAVGSMWGKKPADEKPVTGTTDPTLAVKDEVLTGDRATY